MKKICLALSSLSAYKVTVSQQPIVQPHYEGCVLVYQYGRDYSKCNNQSMYQEIYRDTCKALRAC